PSRARAGRGVALFAAQPSARVRGAPHPALQRAPPAAADLPRPGLGRVPGKARPPLRGDDLSPAERRYILGVVVIHVRKTTGPPPEPGAAGPVPLGRVALRTFCAAGGSGCAHPGGGISIRSWRS